MAILAGAHGQQGMAREDILTRVGVVMGSVRACLPYADELLRSRVFTADGQDYIVTTSTDIRAGQGYLTGAYPVSRGYLVMLRQPLCEFHHADAAAARERHAQLASVLAEAGMRVVRARASLAARKRAETTEVRAPRSPRMWAEDSLDVILGETSDRDLAASRNCATSPPTHSPTGEPAYCVIAALAAPPRPRAARHGTAAPDPSVHLAVARKARC